MPMWHFKMSGMVIMAVGCRNSKMSKHYIQLALTFLSEARRCTEIKYLNQRHKSPKVDAILDFTQSIWEEKWTNQK